MHYQLFLPGIQNANPANLQQFGLAEVFAGGNNPSCVILTQSEASPTDKPGCLLNYTEMRIGDPHGAYSADWHWRCIGDYWIGTNPAEPVKPLDLQRNVTYPGFAIELRDKQYWHLPTYRRIDHCYGIDEKGKRVFVPAAQHQTFFDRCLAVQHEIFASLDLLEILEQREATGVTPDNLSTDEVPVTIHDGLGLICLAMQMNYRINLDIALALELFDESNTARAIAGMIELPEIVACRDEKKNLGDVVVGVT